MTPPGNDGSDLLTTGEVATRYKVLSATVLRWRKRGLRAAVRLPNGEYRFRAEDVQAFLNTQAGLGHAQPEQYGIAKGQLDAVFRRLRRRG